MKVSLQILFLLFGHFFTACGQAQLIDPSEQVSDTAYIPKDLEDCFVQLDKILPDSIKKAMFTQGEKGFITDTHLGIGMWIRNHWVFGAVQDFQPFLMTQAFIIRMIWRP